MDMDKPLAQCIDVLQQLIPRASDPNSIALAEKAIDAYLAEFKKAPSKIGAITMLQATLNSDWSHPKGPQIDLIDLIFDYLAQRTQNLREQP